MLSNLAAGIEVPLRVAKEGYVAKDIVRVIKDGERLVVSEALPKTEDTEMVEINSSPSAKVIWQGNVVINDTPGYARLPHGIQTLSLVYSDWPTQKFTLEVKKGSSISTNFDFPRGRVALDSVPPDATVWVGTNRIGNTPMTFYRPVGSTTFRFERIGFETTNQTVTVTDKGMVSIRPVLVTTNGVFELSSDPAGASIFDSNGKELGRATAGQPVKLIRAPGTHSFTARIEGLSDVTATLTVRKGEDKPHTFLFDYGSVRLDSAPPGATISTEGKVLGLTPATFVQKPGLKSSYRITAPDYLPTTNEVTVQSGERDKVVVAKLLPEPVNVTLTSDPPGAQFYFGAAALSGAQGGSIYPLPWGTNRVTARHPLYPALGELTKSIEVKKGAQNISHFPFEYGTIILTNLPEEIIMKEGNQQLALAPGQGRLAYERPGSHLYDVYDDAGQKITNVTINVQSGRSSIPPPGLVGEIGEIRNSIGMRLVKVRNLVGPGKDGWVGKYEVTQREYQMVMGNNPSINQLGENYPVENVTWEQAMEFCQKLKVSDEKKPPVRGDYKLPSKEQWLFFAEGTDSKDAVKNARTPAPVGSKPPNPKRLYDVLGNVWEWLADTDGVNSVFIGGAYNIGFGFRFGAYEQRAKTFHEAAVGFRVVLIPPNATASTQ